MTCVSGQLFKDAQISKSLFVPWRTCRDHYNTVLPPVLSPWDGPLFTPARPAIYGWQGSPYRSLVSRKKSKTYLVYAHPHYPIHTTAENAHRCALMRILEFAPFTLQPQCAAKRILCPSEAKRSEAKRSEF